MDFTYFHPLDHWPGTKRCGEFYGSFGYHLHLAWTMRRREQLFRVLGRPLCWVGKHWWRVWYSRPPGELLRVQPRCLRCDARREPTAAELAVEPPFFRRRDG